MANGTSVTMRITPESIAILQMYDPTFMDSNKSPNAAIATMHLLLNQAGNPVAKSSEPPTTAKCLYDENRLLKRMSSVVQDACDTALRPYVS